jgi:hypothetical protein
MSRFRGLWRISFLGSVVGHGLGREGSVRAVVYGAIKGWSDWSHESHESHGNLCSYPLL